MTIEELQAKNLELQDKLKEKEADITTLTNVKSSLEKEKETLLKDNTDLKDVNMKLYLRVSQEPQNNNATIINNKPKSVKPKQTSWDNFFDKLK